MNADFCEKTGKVIFMSSHAAYRQLHRIGVFRRTVGGKGKQPQTVYKCPDCGHWHLSAMAPGAYVEEKTGRRPRERYDRHDKSWAREVEL